MQSGVVNYVRREEAVAPAEQASPPVGATVFGTAESEFTPQVRDAVMRLVGEVQELRKELRQTKSRLEEAESTAAHAMMSGSSESSILMIRSLRWSFRFFNRVSWI